MLSTHEHGEQEAAHHGSSDGTGKRDRKGRRVGGGGGGGGGRVGWRCFARGGADGRILKGGYELGR